MNNCLVEKYKGVVNNDNLAKLGVLKLFANTVLNTGSQVVLLNISGEHIIKICNTNEYVVSAWSGCTKIDDHTVKCTGNGAIIMSAECEAILEVQGKYDIEDFSVDNVTDIQGGVDSFYTTLETLSLTKNLMSLTTSSFKKFSNITELRLGNTFVSLVGELNDFVGLSSLAVIVANSGNNKITGNIHEIGHLTSLNTVNLTGNTSIVGSIESFVAAQRANGRTTESTGINLGWGLTNVTFNGESSARSHNSTLTWTADTITYDGVTISA